jgi:hypothetical protein
MIYMRMKDIDQAILHLDNITFLSRPDLFIAASDIAYQQGNTRVVKEILKKVMTSGVNLQDTHIIQNVQVILRSLIRIAYDEMIRTNSPESRAELLAHIISDCKMVKKSLRVHDQNELDWLYRIAWNSACFVSKTDATYQTKTQFFELVIDLFQLFQNTEEVHTDCCEKACFMSIWYRLQAEGNPQEEENIQKILDAISMWKDLTKLLDGVLFYEFEVYCLQKDWDRARNLILQAQKRVLDSSIWKKCAGKIN